MNRKDGNIPVLYISKRTIPEAWESAVIEVWDHGAKLKTEYDHTGDPPSRDATAVIEVLEPLGEPRIHKNFPGGPEELEIYRQEVIDGIHDHWINPQEGKWTYTYHERLFSYVVSDDPEKLKPLHSYRKDGGYVPTPPVDQIEYLLSCLEKNHYTRRAQAITWMPTIDPATDDPPCLQRIWARLLKGDDGIFRLNLNTHWRSRDLYKAWFMNVYALTELMAGMADDLSKRFGEEVRVGRYVDICDSLHIYGSYLHDVEPELEKMKTSPVSERVWTSDHPAFTMMTEETRLKLKENPDFMYK